MSDAYLNLALIAAVGIDNRNSGVFVLGFLCFKLFNFFRFFKAAGGAGSFPFAAFKNGCFLGCYPVTKSVRFLFNRSGFGCAADGAGSCFLALGGAGGFGCYSPLTEGVRCKGKNGVIESIAAAVADIV